MFVCPTGALSRAGGSLGDAFSERACQFHSIEGKCTCFAVLASREPARPGQAGLNAHGGPWGHVAATPPATAGPWCTDLR